METKINVLTVFDELSVIVFEQLEVPLREFGLTVAVSDVADVDGFMAMLTVGEKETVAYAETSGEAIKKALIKFFEGAFEAQE